MRPLRTKLLQLVAIAFLSLLAACVDSGPGAEKLQAVLDKTIGKGHAQVAGIRLAPESGGAVADVKLTDMKYEEYIGAPQGMVVRSWSGAGQASIVKYTDGRWVLKRLGYFVEHMGREYSYTFDEEL